MAAPATARLGDAGRAAGAAPDTPDPTMAIGCRLWLFMFVQCFLYFRISEIRSAPITCQANNAWLLGQWQAQRKRNQAAESHCADIFRGQINTVIFQVTDTALGIGRISEVCYHRNPGFPMRQAGLGNGFRLTN